MVNIRQTANIVPWAQYKCQFVLSIQYCSDDQNKEDEMMAKATYMGNTRNVTEF